MTVKLPYIELLPGTPGHKSFVAQAILKRNYYQLASLKNRLDKPLHLVQNWFFYTLMKQDVNEDVVVIFSPECVEQFDKFKNLKDKDKTEQQGNEDEEEKT